MSIVKLFSKANPSMRLSVDDGRVVMSLDDPSDQKQEWEKLDRPSGDRPAYCEFSLRNCSSNEILTHQYVEDEGELTIAATSTVNFMTNGSSVAGSINTTINQRFSVDARSDFRVRNERGEETAWETSFTTRVTSPRARDEEERGRVTMGPDNGRLSDDILFIMPVGCVGKYKWIRPVHSKTFFLDANIGGEARAEVDLSRQNQNVIIDSHKWKIMHVYL